MKKQWWHGKIAYQIYPRSFQDSNGDGIGDLNGITSRLDYLKALGIDLIWLSPVYVSPGVDNGYDIADYRNIDPKFGTMEDFDELLKGVHARGMQLIMDLVVNHCSSQHPLFKKALADPEGPEAACFYFVKGKNGLPPDNLRSYFGGSVWEKVPGRDNLFYLHYFAKEQPDFNWNCKALRDRVCAMMNWWLDEKGIDGFRIDAIMNVAKDPAFPGLPPDALGDGTCSAAAMTAKMACKAPLILKDLRDRTYGPRGAFTVGEAFGLNPQGLPDICGDDGCFSSVFDFPVRESLEKKPGYYACEKPDAAFWRRGTLKGQALYADVGFPAVITENHDEPRAVSFYLRKDLEGPQGAKCLAAAFMMLRGIPFIYQGQELGMTKTEFADQSEFRDLVAFTEYEKCLSRGMTKAQALERVSLHTRDQSRTPMLWDDSDTAGFTTGTPWIRLHQDHRTLNVKKELADPGSVLCFYKKLIALRKDPQYSECLTWGRTLALDCKNEACMAYVRQSAKQRILVCANFSDKPCALAAQGEILLKTGETALENGALTAAPGAAAVVLLS